jgi:hypothetical protein
MQTLSCLRQWNFLICKPEPRVYAKNQMIVNQTEDCSLKTFPENAEYFICFFRQSSTTKVIKALPNS